MQQTEPPDHVLASMWKEFADFCRRHPESFEEKVERGYNIGYEARDREIRLLLLERLRAVAPGVAERLGAKSSAELLVEALAAAARR